MKNYYIERLYGKYLDNIVSIRNEMEIDEYESFFKLELASDINNNRSWLYPYTKQEFNNMLKNKQKIFCYMLVIEKTIKMPHNMYLLEKKEFMQSYMVNSETINKYLR